MKEVLKSKTGPCVVCGTSQKDRPLTFRLTEHCCEVCRKFDSKEITQSQWEKLMGKELPVLH